MKIKVTIWFEDPDMDEITEDVKEGFKENLENELFDGTGIEIKQIQIEESSWED